MAQPSNTSEPSPSRYLLSTIPASWIDQSLLIAPEFCPIDNSEKMRARLSSLIISQTLFPVCLGFDMGQLMTRMLAEKSLAIITQDTNKSEEAEKTREVFMKCLRGYIFCPTGIYWRDVVSNHFLAERATEQMICPKGEYYTGKGVIERPRTIEEVRRIIHNAINNKKEVSIAGAQFSQGKHIIPNTEDDFHLDMRNMNNIFIDETTKIATVGAGTTWSQLQNEADKLGLAVQVMQASNPFTIGGSLSVNCHGWDHITGSLVNTIQEITIVNAKGELETLTPSDEVFGYIAGGFGLFGVICEVKIQLTNNDELFESAKTVSIESYVEYFRRHIKNNPAVKMHLFRLSLERGRLLHEGWAQNYTTSEPHRRTANLVDEPERGTMMDRILIQIARNSPEARTMWWLKEVSEMKKIRKGTRNQFMRPKINAVFANNSVARSEWLQEYFVPENKLAKFLTFLGNVLNENDVALFNASVRYVTHDLKSHFGYANKDSRFAIVLFFSQSLNKDEVEKTRRWVQRVIDELIKIDGTFYLPYAHLATKEQFQKCYPNWKNVVAMKNIVDPSGLFNNGFYHHYFNEEDKNV